jgi:hypothetical protein
MSEAFGLGDGMNDMGNIRPLAESAVADARRKRHGHCDTGRWPGAGTVVRVLVLSFVAIVCGGWLLTVLNA